MFKVTPDKVKAIFIVRENLRDTFLDQIYSTGATWFRYQFEKLVDHLETKDCLVLDSKDVNLERLFKKIDEPAYLGKFVYLVGADEHLKSINPFSHYIYNRSSEWGDFNMNFKRVYGHDFNSLLKLTNEIQS
jgi:hypothetical protein